MISPLGIRFLISVLFAFPAAAQTTWYVDGNGTPPGSGSATDPFTRIQQAVDHPAVLSGSLIVVAPGVYPEKVAITNKVLTLRSKAGPAVTWIEPHAPTLHVGFMVNAGFSVIDGFTISGARVASSIGVIGTAATVRNCVVQGHQQDPGFPTSSGWGLASSADLWVEGCTVSGNFKGLFLGYVSAVYSSNSIFQGNSQWDLDPLTLFTVSTIS